MTDKQDALDFIETIYERELRDFGSHSIHDPTHEQRLKHILSFQKHIETIRQALTAPAVDLDGVESLENDLKCLSGYCPDHFDESPNCQQECAMFVREHITTIFDLIRARGLIGNAEKSDTVAVQTDVLEKIAYALDRASQFKTNDTQTQLEKDCLSLLQPYTKGE